jgi:toxin-antitoxin system PIN domain toxin
MIHLLDTNILIALGDVTHVHAKLALDFFETRAVREGWATCPLTENAFLRIMGNPKYPGGTGSTAQARRALSSILAAPGHRFWPDDQSLMEAARIPVLPASQQLTDCYLLALAASKGGCLTTFDRSIDPSCVKGGGHALLVLGKPNETEPQSRLPSSTGLA